MTSKKEWKRREKAALAVAKWWYEKCDSITTERDRARGIAVQLERELADLQARYDDLARRETERGFCATCDHLEPTGVHPDPAAVALVRDDMHRDYARIIAKADPADPHVWRHDSRTVGVGVCDVVNMPEGWEPPNAALPRVTTTADSIQRPSDISDDEWDRLCRHHADGIDYLRAARATDQQRDADFDDIAAGFHCACGWPQRVGWAHTADGCDRTGAA